MKKKKENSFEELMKGIDWNRYLPAIVGIMQPVVLFGLWLGFAKIDKRADALSKLIAIAEPLPFEIDLNVPQPVVLASLYHSVDEALDILEEVITQLENFNFPSIDEIVKRIKKELTPDIIEETEFAERKEGESWQSFLERRLRETGLFG